MIARWIARVIASISIAFFLFMVIGGIIYDLGPITLLGVLVVCFAVLLLLSILFAWWKEGIGGLILTICSVAFAIFIFITAGSNRLLASVLISSPFLLSGLLFLIASRDE